MFPDLRPMEEDVRSMRRHGLHVAALRLVVRSGGSGPVYATDNAPGVSGGVSDLTTGTVRDR